MRAIACGNACAAFEFGAKVNLCVVVGYCIVDRLLWDPYNESTDLKNQVDDYRR